MVHAISRKSRPTPLKDVQIAVQLDESRRCLVLDAHASLPYPFEQQAVSSPLQEDHSVWLVSTPCATSRLWDPLSSTQTLVTPSVVLSPGTSDHRWNNSLDSQDDSHLDPVLLHSLRPYRSFTPPISPPALPLPEPDTGYSSKRSGMTFALVPAEVDGKHVFTHVVVNRRGNGSTGNSGPPSIPAGEDGFPEDMQDILRQLDDLASWVKAASLSRDCISNIESIRLARHPGTGADGDNTSHLSIGASSNKGKNRLLPTGPPNSECGIRRDLVETTGGATPGNPTNIFPATNHQSEGFIYIPNCNTPEFLVGSSNSPIAYPVRGYSSHPLRYPPLPSIHDIPYHRRFLERRSAPCPPPTPPLVSPPSGKTSFKTLFQRSRCNTTTVSRPSISSGHVPVESALRQGKRMRLPWIRI